MINEIVLYSPNELAEHIEVRFDEDTVWLNRQQIASLFGRDIKTVGKHINNAFSEGELDKDATVAKFATVQKEGGRNIKRSIEFYNLDVIISVGYRIKSVQGTHFRIWATKRLKDYLLKGYAINNRMTNMEDNFQALKSKVDEIDFQINTHRIPTQGVFVEGQVFDAYEFVSKIIRAATKNIILIDNYIDETTLTHLAKKTNGVRVLLLTKNVSNQLTLDVQKANAQYGDFKVNQFTHSHDRFLITDSGSEVYHIGASLKDLGKKWFAFSKMDKKSVAGIISTVVGFL